MAENTDSIEVSEIDDSDSSWDLSFLSKATKAVFDHFRNYLICASLFIAGREANISYDVEPLDKVIIAIASILTLLNAAYVLIVIWSVFASIAVEASKEDQKIRAYRRLKNNAPIAALLVSGLYLTIVGMIINFTVSIRF